MDSDTWTSKKKKKNYDQDIGNTSEEPLPGHIAVELELTVKLML